MSRAGSSRPETPAPCAPRARSRRPDQRSGEAGFTLFEMLIVMTILAMAMASMSMLYREPSGASRAKAAALLTASRLRDLRASAMTNRSERYAEIVPSKGVLSFGDGRAALRLDPSIEISVTAADSERRSPESAGIRFFPNGSSTGATIKLRSDRQSYEVRVNWLTGRVSASAL
jgi:general secretion pathway protein H